MFTRIQTRLTVLYAGLFALALGLVACALYAVVVQTAERQVRDQLAASGTVFDRLWDMRSRELRNAAGLLSRDYGFRAAVATGDKATALSALDNLKQRFGLDVAFIVGTDGQVASTAGGALHGDAGKLWDALDQGQEGGIIRLHGMPHQVIAAPILAPVLTGWVVFATELGPNEMRLLERLSAIPLRADVVQRMSDGSWSTRSQDGNSPDQQALDRFLRAADGRQQPGELESGAGVSIALAKPLRVMGEGAPAVLLLRYPMARAMAAYQPLEMAVAVTGILGLLLLLIGSWRLSLSITKPISALDQAARQMQEGAAIAVPIETQDEIGRLAQSFNRMSAEIAERERRITQLAFIDTLTGLPNRSFFREQLGLELQQASHRKEALALLCIDLDNFKAINDTLGHPTGDELLRAIAERLREQSVDALVARLGGDEFTIVSPAASQDSPAVMAERIIEAISKPLAINGHELSIGASVGIAVYPSDGTDSDMLLKSADLALHQAKDEGRGTYRFFEAGMNARAQSRRLIEADLRRALTAGEFELYFQPLFDLAAERICAFEALLRWNHPARGLMAPAEFIPIAEETGLIVPIGTWVIQEACRQARSWPKDIRVAVNVSSIQFRKSGLANAVMQALAVSGLEPARLEVEITESIFLENSEATLSVLHSLRALGIKIALDDFGTGYSSLSYLQSFPFDKIKIDRSFIQELLNRPGASAIVQAIIDLARALGMETTAEGVEEKAQLAELKVHGCSSVQGYLFSRPVDAKGAMRLLGAREDKRRVA